MNILVAMKQTPDLRQLRLRERRPVLEGAPKTFGDLDKNALEAAVALKAEGDKVTVLGVGDAELEDTVKEALAAGADEAVLVLVGEGTPVGAPDSRVTAALLAAAVKTVEAPALLIMGEGSGDGYSGQVVGRVAELLGWPQVGFARELRLEQGEVVAVRSLEDVLETVAVPLPAVVSVSAEINEPRIPAVTAILRAGRKPKRSLNAAELVVEPPPPGTRTLSALAPEVRRRGERLGGVADLAAVLADENLI
ncbi:MAG: electron transfer flavoprotein subunit beta/FixA family protein [Bifidobacteriaceae bacterium]|jgi:electron transfer flavoprotein beta subunit|nr:electron transfer flavoprotein subunit beta/FixA family protein [Bifidobacteriaceae bacterium]